MFSLCDLWGGIHEAVRFTDTGRSPVRFVRAFDGGSKTRRSNNAARCGRDARDPRVSHDAGCSRSGRDAGRSGYAQRGPGEHLLCGLGA